MKRMTGYLRYPIALLILAVIGTAAGAPPVRADVPLQVPHDPLTRLVGFPSYFKETGWQGLTLGPVGAYLNLRFGVGGKLTELDMYGYGKLDPLAGQLWFEGYHGTAEMGLGLDAKASYKLEVRILPWKTLTFTADIFDANYGVFDSEDFVPYLLGGGSVTLVDDFGPIPIAEKEFEIKLTETKKLDAKIGLELGVEAVNKIEGVKLSTDRGEITAEGMKRSVTITRPTYVVGSIVQTSKSTWQLGLTPTVVFTVHFGVDFDFPIEIVTIPLTLPPYTFSTEPRAITFATGCINRYYHDADDDGYGDPADLKIDCSLPVGYEANANDCDDTVRSVNPAAAETPGNLRDDNCDGQVDETNVWYRDADGDAYGDPAVTAEGSTVPPGYADNATDCNDTIAAVHPGAQEYLNGRDDDCDGAIDEGDWNTYYRDVDGDGYGDPAVIRVAQSPPAGFVALGGDCDDLNRHIHPKAPEFCDGMDEDCNGLADDGLKIRFYRDEDSDGYGSPKYPHDSCAIPVDQATDPDLGTRYALNNRDCDDGNAAVNPRRPEICGNDKDENCSGEVDETCHPPVADDRSIVVDEDAEASIVLSASDTDGDPVTFAVLSSPSHGVLSGTAPAVAYAPAPNYSGTDTLTYAASDGRYLSNIATVSITVRPVNDRPTANAGPDQTLPVGPACTATAVMNGAGCSDADADPLAYAWSWMGMAAGGVSPPVTVQEGTFSIALVVNDGKESSLTDNMTLTAVDLTPPSVAPPPNVTAECSGPSGQPVAYGTADAADNCCMEAVTASGPAVFFPGQATVTWTAKDCNGNTTTATQLVTVQDAAAPALTVSVSPDLLWPPNHRMVEVVPAVSASDLCCGSNMTVVLQSVNMSEGDGEDTFDMLYDVDPTTGFIGDDIQVVGGKIYLRAERSGKSDGRVYTITYRATDCAGNTSLASATVTVPHDQR